MRVSSHPPSCVGHSSRARRRDTPPRRDSEACHMACVTACAVPAAPRKTRVCVSHKVSTKCALRLRGVGMSLSPRSRGTVVVPRVLPSTAELETAQLVSIAGFGVLIGSFAVILGLKGEPEPCPSCAQRGGEACIFCDATGRRESPVNISKTSRINDSVAGLTQRSPLECTACKGAGMILCKTCRGTGFK